MLIHKYGLSDDYPSVFQEDLPLPEDEKDRRILIRATVKDTAGQPISDQPVWFRVKDLADTAPYVPSPQEDDNKDEDVDDDSGTVDPPMDESDASGIVETILTVTDQFAGDNYQIEAFFEDPVPNPNAVVVGTSGTITAWKRIYLEKDLMFRRGSYVKEFDNVGGADRIHVMDKSKFDDCTRVRIVHAPRLDGADPAPAFYSEEHNVTGTISDGSSNGGYIILAGGETLVFSYGPDDSFDGATFQSDGVGCIVGNNPVGTFDINQALLKGIFDTTYVEFVDVAQPNSIPFDPQMNGSLKHLRIANKWFENSYRDPLNPQIVLAPSNHQHVLSGSRTSNAGDLGVTTVNDGTNHSWLWTKRIESKVRNQTRRANMKAEVYVHELAHQWRVNHDDPTFSNGHCYHDMYFSEDLLCTMHQDDPLREEQFKDGIVGFHYTVTMPGTTTSEYLTIRERTEPLPQEYPD